MPKLVIWLAEMLHQGQSDGLLLALDSKCTEDKINGEYKSLFSVTSITNQSAQTNLNDLH